MAGGGFGPGFGGGFGPGFGGEEAPTGPEFIGPPIDNLSLLVDVAMGAVDFSTLFSGSGLTFAAVGSLPTGLSLSSAGVLSGTPTVLGTSGSLVIRATDDQAETIDSNTFQITVLVAPVASGRARSRLGFGLGVG